MLLAGTGVAFVALLLWTALNVVGKLTAASFFLPVMLLLFGHGLTLPNAISGVVSVRPHLAGTASGFGGAMQVGGGGAMSVLAATLVSAHTGALPLFIVMLALTLAAFTLALWLLLGEKLIGKS